MAKDHGARQQKRLAKQKAKRLEKRSILARLSSKDPTIRLQRAERWPVVESMAGAKLWKDGIGYLAIARREAEGRLVFAVFLVDVYCLGVKNAFWQEGESGDFKDLIQKMETTQPMRPISAACLVKIVKGAVEYARSFGFPPHPDYRHAATLLAGIDTATCTQEFTFGRDGKPFYIQGPHESPAQARAISERIAGAGGHYLFELADPGSPELADSEDDFDEIDSLDDDSPDELP
jgi:hypothetical protein